jgi:hypothetical protein
MPGLSEEQKQLWYSLFATELGESYLNWAGGCKV